VKSYSYIDRNGFFSMESWNSLRHLIKIMSSRHLSGLSIINSKFSMTEVVVFLWQSVASLGGCWPTFRDTFVCSVHRNCTLLSSEMGYKPLYSSFKYLRQKETRTVSWNFIRNKLKSFMLLGALHWVKIIQTSLDSQK